MTASTLDSHPLHPPRIGPLEWIRSRLFPNLRSGILTILLAPVVVYALYRGALFFFVNGRWEVVTRNLTLFMQGTYPRGEQWRIVAQLMLLALALGVGASTSAASRADIAREAGLTVGKRTPLSIIKRFWSLIVFVLVLLYFAATVTPWLVMAGTVAAFLVGTSARFIPSRFRNIGWTLAALILVAAFQVVVGTVGYSWMITAGVLAAGAWATFQFEGVEGRRATVYRTSVAVAAAVVAYFVYTVLVFPGVGWDHWSGLHLTLWVSAFAIVLSFPLGLLLALARRSTLPVLRWVSTGYIELIRGVPLITLLFMGQYILGFMLPQGTDPSSITRAITAMTLFTAAYVAEIVRGGLQSIPHGQTEAGLALGLPTGKLMRMIVLPQALRSVIPALVGQFISIFKDSSLLYILAIHEFLGVRSLVHAQPDFRVIAHAESLVFVAIGYWAFAYAMSKESQRLEVRLRAGKS